MINNVEPEQGWAGNTVGECRRVPAGTLIQNHFFCFDFFNFGYKIDGKTLFLIEFLQLSSIFLELLLDRRLTLDRAVVRLGLVPIFTKSKHCLAKTNQFKTIFDEILSFRSGFGFRLLGFWFFRSDQIVSSHFSST